MNTEIENKNTLNRSFQRPDARVIGSGIVNLTRRQADIEKTYKYNLAASEPLGPEARPTPQEIIERMEFDHAVKNAPLFEDQLRDTSRSNRITFVRQEGGLGIATSHNSLAAQRYGMTEHEALNDLADYLDVAVTSFKDINQDRLPPQIKYMREDLTFIGKKEYEEATQGIAAYWKGLLNQDPALQVLVLNKPLETSQEEDEEPMLKSGDYLLDTVLAEFSDKEIMRYANRLITDPDDISIDSPSNLRTVLLDDWVVSGGQINNIASEFRAKYPELASTLELQLVATDRKRITSGLETQEPSLPSIPVRAYFMAHESSFAESSEAIITGTHSTVDFDFEEPLEIIASLARKSARLTSEQHARLDTMPAMTNIVRPYRAEGAVLMQKERFDKAHNIK